MWARIFNIIIGIWLMVAPGLLGYGAAASDNGHIVGPVIATFSTIACWEATRVVRKWNFPLGIWLILAPWVLGYELNQAIISDMLCGLMILAFASIRGQINGKYGGGWRVLWKQK